jgi:hypothetical protein
MGDVTHEALGLQGAERLADWHDARAELAGQLLLTDGVTGPKGSRGQQGAERDQSHFVRRRA